MESAHDSLNMKMADKLQSCLTWVKFAKDDGNFTEKTISYLRALAYYNEAEQFAIENNML